MNLLRQGLSYYVFRVKPVVLPELEKVQTENFLLLCEAHGITGPLATFFEHFAPRHELVAPLQARREAVALRNLWLKDEQVRVTESLTKAELAHQVLKGLPLIDRLYASLSERPCADIDLLCRFEDFTVVLTTLKNLGYQPSLANFVSLQRLAKAGEGLEFNSASGATLDVHFDTPSYFEFAPLAGLAGSNLVKKDLDDLSLFALLCDHGSKHMWHRLIWLLDLSLLLQSSKELNPAKLSQHFCKHGYNKVLKFTLGLLKDYALLPPAYIPLSDKPNLERQRRYVAARHVRLISDPEIFPRNFWLHLAIIEGFPQKLSYTIARIFHPNAKDFKGKEENNVFALRYLAIRLMNLIVYRASRFFGPIRKWLLFTNTTISSSRAKLP